MSTHNTEEPLALYRTILQRIPDSVEIRYNIAYTLKKQGKVHEATTIFKEILSMRPDYASAHFSLALSYLLAGKFIEGFQEYEYRWQSYGETPKKFTSPLWDGSNPAGKTILMK